MAGDAVAPVALGACRPRAAIEDSAVSLAAIEENEPNGDMEPSLGTQDDPGATYEIALVAEPAQQGRVSVWKRPLLSAGEALSLLDLASSGAALGFSCVSLTVTAGDDKVRGPSNRTGCVWLSSPCIRT
jgi:hypothetical protein